MANRLGKSGNSERFSFLGLQNHCVWWLQATLPPWKKSYDKPKQHIEKQKHHFANKSLLSQNCGFFSSHVWMWELDHKEGWALKNCCFQITVLEKTLESPLNIKEIKPVNPKGNQPWRADAEAEPPILWSPDAKSQLTGKTLMPGKTEDRRKKGRQRMRRLNGITDSMDMGVSKLWEIVKEREAWYAEVHGVAKNRTPLSDSTWTTTIATFLIPVECSVPSWSFRSGAHKERWELQINLEVIIMYATVKH